MSHTLRARRTQAALTVTAALVLGAALGATTHADGDGAVRRLSGHVPAPGFVARELAAVPADERIDLALTLPLRNQNELQDLLPRLYNPHDPEYGRFLSTKQFRDRFAPTEAQYSAVARFAVARGLTVTGTHSNRLILDVAAPSAVVERAFSTRLKRYQSVKGRIFRAPAAEPGIPAELEGTLAGVVGLDDLVVQRPHLHRILPRTSGVRGTGSGPGGGLTPSDVRTAYNLGSSGVNGAGQTLALFELDGYNASDIATYATQFGLPQVPLQNVLVDGASGSAGSGADEVTLDIELQMAVAPGASKIAVYEGPNSGVGVLDTYNRIAADNTAKSISTSWGAAENANSASALQSEASIFQQMAAQGQSIFAASGDSGAYDDGRTLSVDDPASQPYVTGVGGTHLTTNGAGGSYSAESTWNGGSVSAGGSGGGISAVWSQPSYQSGAISSASGGSTTMRNVPDVAMDGDPNTGYAIYSGGRWAVFGGTSCGAPIWSAITALANQGRAAAGHAPLGFMNPTLYSIGLGVRGTTDFHDIADGSTNLYYKAVAGYDLATGWGTPNGANLLTDLGSVSAGTGTTGGTGGTGTTGGTTSSQLLGNPGFENGTNAAPWTASPSVIDNGTSIPPHSGSWKAYLDGYGTTHTDTLAQTVTIPSTVNTATLTFWLRVDTQERTRTRANDTLKVQLRNSSGAVLATLATFSNLTRTNGYLQETFNLSAYRGQTVTLYLVGTENGSYATAFNVDDFALTVN